ncbi:hypothetical protein ACFFK0_26635 [Paenibacillus chartarius]|uniref:Uncharacterized protein n=1 Tax=Paenibacillus chartarius TaxID=747481 RepID=A0ABV6DTJ6_9BACL
MGRRLLLPVAGNSRDEIALPAFLEDGWTSLQAFNEEATRLCWIIAPEIGDGIEDWLHAKGKHWRGGYTVLRLENRDIRQQQICIRALLADQPAGERSILHFGFANHNDAMVHLLHQECLQSNLDEMIIPGGGTNSVGSKVDVDEYMENERVYHICREWVLSGNYRAALKLTKSLQLRPEVGRLLQLGDNVLRYSLEEAEQEFRLLESVLSSQGSHETELAYIREWSGLCRYDAKSTIYYLYTMSEMYYEQERLVEFFVFFYRLVEEWLLYALGWDLQYGRPVRKSKPQSGYSVPVPPMMTYSLSSMLRVLSEQIGQLQRRKKISISKTGWQAHSFLQESERRLLSLYVLLKDEGFSDLLDLRHEGVSGHGFADYSLSECVRLCQGKAPLDKIKPLLNQWGLIPPLRFFDVLNRSIVCLLDEELYRRNMQPV